MQKKIPQKLYLAFTICFTFIFCLPQTFSRSNLLFNADKLALKHTSKKFLTIAPKVELPLYSSLYDSLQLKTIGLGKPVFEYAMMGFNQMIKLGSISNKQIISIIDFSKPSNLKRLFVIDLENYKVLYNTYVAHGVKSGKEIAKHFSNSMESHKTSLGFYTTLGTYEGKHGYSLHLNGLEKGINDNAYNRNIVMHAADYVNEYFIKANGFLGRSFGCPAVSKLEYRPIINKIKNGTCLFIYGPDQSYIKKSRLLNESYKLDLPNI